VALSIGSSFGGAVFPHAFATTTMADFAGSPAVACALAGSRQSETKAEESESHNHLGVLERAFRAVPSGNKGQLDL